jgi:hypothetical protein
MIKVGDRLTIDNQLVEVTFVMNEKTYAYRPVKDVVISKDEVVDTPKKRGRRPKE